MAGVKNVFNWFSYSLWIPKIVAFILIDCDFTAQFTDEHNLEQNYTQFEVNHKVTNLQCFATGIGANYVMFQLEVLADGNVQMSVFNGFRYENQLVIGVTKRNPLFLQ